MHPSIEESIYKKLGKIESEIQSLKVLIFPQKSKEVISLKGLLKGIKITEEEIEEAKRSLFKGKV